MWYMLLNYVKLYLWQYIPKLRYWLNFPAWQSIFVHLPNFFISKDQSFHLFSSLGYWHFFWSKIQTWKLSNCTICGVPDFIHNKGWRITLCGIFCLILHSDVLSKPKSTQKLVIFMHLKFLVGRLNKLRQLLTITLQWHFLAS